MLRVAALLLAAGSSRRMGTSKQLLQLGNKTVLRHCAETLVRSGLEDLVVVTGGDHAACIGELEGTKAKVVQNDDPACQMADSVRNGMRAVDETCSGVLVCLADHPLVSADTHRALLDVHRREPDKIIIPVFEGRRGHPTLFPYDVIHDIFFSASLRDLVRGNSDRVSVVEVRDEGVVLDMDTQDDYRKIRERHKLRTAE